MSAKQTLDPRLTKAEAHLELAQEQIRKITPSVGDPDPTTIAITHLATAMDALTRVLKELDSQK